MEFKGIDVSKHNGTLDWEKIKAAGVEFAMLRTGIGKESPVQKDLQFERNYSECKRLGIPVGAYHYSYAKTPEDARKEAEFCIKILTGKRLEYPVFFDIEDEKAHRRLSKAVCTEMAKAFCNRLEAAGYWAGIYSFDSFFQSHLEEALQKRYAIWVARVENVKPAYAKRYDLWQYSWKGKIPGSSAETDLNICYKDFPAAVKKAGKNGYGQAETLYTLTVPGLTKAKAEELGKLSGKQYTIKEE